MKWYGLVPAAIGGWGLLHAGHSTTVADIVVGVAVALVSFGLYYRLVLRPERRHERVTGDTRSDREDRSGNHQR